MREQAPFWMSQASIAYSVPDKYGQPGVEDIPLPGKYGPLTYNTVEFDESRQIVNSGNASRGYLSMGSFFSSIDNEPNSNINIDNVTGRYFLVAAGEEGWSIGDTELPRRTPSFWPLLAPSPQPRRRRRRGFPSVRASKTASP